MEIGEARAILGRLRALRARGASLRKAAAALGKPKSTLFDWCRRNSLRLAPSRRLPNLKIRQLDRLLDRGESERVIARWLQISTKTVWRRKRQRRAAAGDPAIVGKYKCPGCDQEVIFRPCQICRARERRKC